MSKGKYGFRETFDSFTREFWFEAFDHLESFWKEHAEVEGTNQTKEAIQGNQKTIAELREVNARLDAELVKVKDELAVVTDERNLWEKKAEVLGYVGPPWDDGENPWPDPKVKPVVGDGWKVKRKDVTPDKVCWFITKGEDGRQVDGPFPTEKEALEALRPYLNEPHNVPKDVGDGVIVGSTRDRLGAAASAAPSIPAAIELDLIDETRSIKLTDLEAPGYEGGRFSPHGLFASLARRQGIVTVGDLELAAKGAAMTMVDFIVSKGNDQSYATDIVYAVARTDELLKASKEPESLAGLDADVVKVLNDAWLRSVFDVYDGAGKAKKPLFVFLTEQGIGQGLAAEIMKVLGGPKKSDEPKLPFPPPGFNGEPVSARHPSDVYENYPEV